MLLPNAFRNSAVSGSSVPMSWPILQGVTPSTVYSLLNPARHQISITTIKKLCDDLDVTLGQFFACSLFDRLEQEMR